MRARRAREVAADRLETALSFNLPGHPEEQGLVDAAAALAPGVPIREAKRAQTKDRMLRAAAAAWTESRSDAGTLDAQSPEPDVFTAEVGLPDGTVRLANVEKISAETAAEIAQLVADFDRSGGE